MPPLSSQLSEAIGSQPSRQASTESDRLGDALAEALNQQDVAKTFSTLAKFNSGLWKSEKQARFLLNTIDGAQFKDRAAEAWAHKHGFDGRAFAVMQRIEGYGSSNASKARYWAQVFVVDNYGVVARGKVKVIHPKGEDRSLSLDWNDVTVEFKRTAKPVIGVDTKAELRAAIEKNRPTIDLIKTIPGWESKDILVDFMRQLEGGRALSLGQLAVVQKMVPDKELFLGAKADWPKHFDGYRKLALKILETFHRTYVEFERSRVPEYEATVARGAYYGWAIPDPDQIDATYKEAIHEFKANNTVTSHSWIDSQLMSALRDILPDGRRPPGVAMYGTSEVAAQFAKAMKAKNPSKISLSVVTWLSYLADKANDESAIKRVADIGELQRARDSKRR